MADVSNIIWETCKTYLMQQGKFILGLWILIAICMVYYFAGLQKNSAGDVVAILACSIFGIGGSVAVALFGIRINTKANSRAAFASLAGSPLKTLFIPLRAGMSIGLLLVCVELFCMICILAFVPPQLAGPCFIGFAIGESLGAAALRICGGIFTKIADIGADLMKIVFNLPEDDPKNPGVIADCTGDNAGDSIGPTADGFETYGVTSVALIAFLSRSALEQSPALCGKLIIWLFGIQILMVLASLLSFYINKFVATANYGSKKDFNAEGPLTVLVWITSVVSFAVVFVASYFLLRDFTVPGATPRCRARATDKPLVAAGRNHFLRYFGRGADHGVHENLRQHQFPSRSRSDHCFRTRRRVAEHFVGPGRGKFFGLLDGVV